MTKYKFELNALDPMVEDELSYWRATFSHYQVYGDGYIDWRLSTDSFLQVEFEELIKSSRLSDSTSPVKILDVGCGPLSTLGKKASFDIEIIGVDPLADEYKKILFECGVMSPHQSFAGIGENLLDLFDKESFDFIFSKNALDHCNNPNAVITNMIALAKPNAKIFINVCQNEGENAAYSGFHRWNFDVYLGRVVVWNAGGISFLDQIVGGRPYQYKKYKFGEGRLYNDQFDIVVHNVTIGGDSLYSAAKGIYAKYSIGHGYIQIEVQSGSEFSESHSFFIHCFVGESINYSVAFKWDTGTNRRSFIVECNKYSKVRIGQYSSSGQGADIKYNNLWASDVLSVD